MQATEVKGLVIRSVDYKESDRLITIFTEEMGTVSAIAKGARTVKSRFMSSASQFCYASFVLYKKGDLYWVKEASLIESFFGLRESIEGLALGTYVLEILNHVTVSEAERELLRLSLNTLYAISQNLYPLKKIKAAFEIRLMAIIGFMPEVVHCVSCGRTDGDFIFDIMGGSIECMECHDQRQLHTSHAPLDESEERYIATLLTPGAKMALSYCIFAPLNKIFSFDIPEDEMQIFATSSEKYLLNHLERSFKSLEFYNEVKV
jgi:DNA repair protein RecO (recombination protein O)